jgi:hypothetical protein
MLLVGTAILLNSWTIGCTGGDFVLETPAAAPDAGGQVSHSPDTHIPPDVVKPTVDSGPSSAPDAGHASDAVTIAPDASPPDAGGPVPDAGTPAVCVNTLSNVGTGDFRIAFSLTTTASGVTIGLLSQRTGCTMSTPFWDVTLSATGAIVASTDDGDANHYAFAVSGTAVNDGQTHRIVVTRAHGALWISSDGAVISAMSPDPYAIGALPPWTGPDQCSGTQPLVGYGVLTNVCLSSP